MANATVEIKGIYALLMHRFPMEEIEAIEKKTPEEQAEIFAYRMPDEELYIPSVCLQRSLINSGGYSKGKGRASLTKTVAACVFVNPEHLLLNTKNYNIDSRRVVNPSTKGGVVRHRPRLEEGWRISFDLEWDETLLSEAQMRKVVDDAGKRVGLLDFRPEKKGPFGRFIVTKWETC